MATSEKVSKYEHFLNEVLREDLKIELERRDQLYENIATHTQLKQTVECILSAPLEDGFKTQVDIGCNFYVQAHVPDTTFIFVNVGLGIHLQFTLEEAIKYVNKKVAKLNKEVEASTKRTAELKGKIKFVFHALAELQDLKTLPNQS